MALALLFSGAITDRHRWVLTRVPSYLADGILKLPYLIPTLIAVLVDRPGNQAPVIANLWRYAMAAACLAAAWAPRMRTMTSEVSSAVKA